jgi:hypothetical protein
LVLIKISRIDLNIDQFNFKKKNKEKGFLHYSFIYFIQLKNQRKRERENLLVIVEYEKKRD